MYKRQALVSAGAWRPLAEQLVTGHYDPAYRRGGEGLYRRSGAAEVLGLPALDDLALAAAAAALAAGSLLTS